MKIKTCLLKSNKIFFNTEILTIFLLVLFLNTSLFLQLPTAQQMDSKMKAGWNLGNTLEAICGETAWGPVIMQFLLMLKTCRAVCIYIN